MSTGRPLRRAGSLGADSSHARNSRTSSLESPSFFRHRFWGTGHGERGRVGGTGEGSSPAERLRSAWPSPLVNGGSSWQQLGDISGDIQEFERGVFLSHPVSGCTGPSSVVRHGTACNILWIHDDTCLWNSEQDVPSSCHTCVPSCHTVSEDQLSGCSFPDRGGVFGPKPK